MWLCAKTFLNKSDDEDVVAIQNPKETDKEGLEIVEGSI